jgi:hypothetical protein
MVQLPINKRRERKGNERDGFIYLFSLVGGRQRRGNKEGTSAGEYIRGRDAQFWVHNMET